MSAHTPGPWLADEDTNTLRDEEGRAIANFRNAGELVLAAAAPDLLAALRCAEARLDQPVLHTDSGNASGILRGDILAALVAIRAALAKAGI